MFFFFKWVRILPEIDWNHHQGASPAPTCIVRHQTMIKPPTSEVSHQSPVGGGVGQNTEHGIERGHGTWTSIRISLLFEAQLRSSNGWDGTRSYPRITLLTEAQLYKSRYVCPPLIYHISPFVNTLFETGH